VRPQEANTPVPTAEKRVAPSNGHGTLARVRRAVAQLAEDIRTPAVRGAGRSDSTRMPQTRSNGGERQPTDDGDRLIRCAGARIAELAEAIVAPTIAGTSGPHRARVRQAGGDHAIETTATDGVGDRTCRNYRAIAQLPLAVLSPNSRQRPLVPSLGARRCASWSVQWPAWIPGGGRRPESGPTPVSMGRPSWPDALLPQQYRTSFLVSPQVCDRPATIARKAQAAAHGAGTELLNCGTIAYRSIVVIPPSNARCRMSSARSCELRPAVTCAKDRVPRIAVGVE